MSPTAKSQQQTKRLRADRTLIATILPPTERARLAALNAHTATAGATAFASSTASSEARTNHTTTGLREPSGAPHTATPISAPSVHPSHNGNHTTAPQRQPERPHVPPHTPAYTAWGTKGCEAGATEINVAMVPPSMAAPVLPGKPDAAHAAPSTWATVHAPSAEYELHPHNDPSDSTSTTDAAMTDRRDSGSLERPRPLPRGQAWRPHSPGPKQKTCTQSLTTTCQGTIPPPAPLRSRTGKSCPRNHPDRYMWGTTSTWRDCGGLRTSTTERPHKTRYTPSECISRASAATGSSPQPSSHIRLTTSVCGSSRNHDHIHEHNNTPHLYHYTTDQLTTGTY